MLSFCSGNASPKVSRQMKTSELLSQVSGDGRTLQDCQAEGEITRILLYKPFHNSYRLPGVEEV